jgi:hypothetical protein
MQAFGSCWGVNDVSEMEGAPSSGRDRLRSLGVSGAILGVVQLAGATVIWLSVAANPPEWLRIIGFWAFLLGLPASLILDAIGLRARPRTPAIIGFVLCAVSIAAMVPLQLKYG